MLLLVSAAVFIPPLVACASPIFIINTPPHALSVSLLVVVGVGVGVGVVMVVGGVGVYMYIVLLYCIDNIRINGCCCC